MSVSAGPALVLIPWVAQVVSETTVPGAATGVSRGEYSVIGAGHDTGVPRNWRQPHLFPHAAGPRGRQHAASCY